MHRPVIVTDANVDRKHVDRNTTALSSSLLLACLCPVASVPPWVVDSCEDESIDELAAFLGVGEQVAALTAK